LDLEDKSDEELREVLALLQAEENEISFRRRVLHGRMDILRAEIVRRLKDGREAGDDVISGADIGKLAAILARDLRGPSRAGREPATLEETTPEDS
jgi:hypothetical protein